MFLVLIFENIFVNNSVAPIIHIYAYLDTLKYIHIYRLSSYKSNHRVEENKILNFVDFWQIVFYRIAIVPKHISPALYENTTFTKLIHCTIDHSNLCRTFRWKKILSYLLCFSHYEWDYHCIFWRINVSTFLMIIWSCSLPSFLLVCFSLLDNRSSLYR